MAKFYMEDESIVSTDEIIERYSHKEKKPDLIELEEFLKHMDDIVPVPMEKMKLPHGEKNYIRLSNINPCDLLTHIQKGLNMKNLCILQLITGELHECLKFNPECEYESASNRNCEECIQKWIIDKKW